MPPVIVSTWSVFFSPSSPSTHPATAAQRSPAYTRFKRCPEDTAAVLVRTDPNSIALVRTPTVDNPDERSGHPVGPGYRAWSASFPKEADPSSPGHQHGPGRDDVDASSLESQSRLCARCCLNRYDPLAHLEDPRTRGYAPARLPRRSCRPAVGVTGSRETPSVGGRGASTFRWLGGPVGPTGVKTTPGDPSREVAGLLGDAAYGLLM